MMENRDQFFWSFSKHRAFWEAREEYFLKYCVSEQTHPESLAMHARFVKKLLAADEWLCILLKNEIIEHIKLKQNFQSQSERLKQFKNSLFRKFRKETANFANAKKRGENAPNLKEIIASPDTKIPEILLETEKRLRLIFAKFAESPFARNTLEVKYIQIKDHVIPDFFYESGVKIWVAPDLSWCDDQGKLNIFKLHPKSFEESPEWDFQNGVYAIFAEKKFRTDILRVETVSLFFGGENSVSAVPVAYHRGREETIQTIMSDTKCMTEFETKVRQTSAFQ